jgi:hypothetical protein
MENSRQLIPAARRADLVIQEADGETLIYDLKSHKAHCLNPTAALVWKHCDGRRTAAQVAERVAAEVGEPVSQEVVWLAVELLEKRRLLDVPAEGKQASRGMTRREMARRLGIATAIALPFIASIKAPAALQALSCGTGGAACGGANPPCCPGFACNAFSNMCQAT